MRLRAREYSLREIVPYKERMRKINIDPSLAKGGYEIPPVLTYVGHSELNVTTATQPFPNVPLGAVASDRLIIAVAGSGITNNRTITGITIGGTPMTLHQMINGAGTAFNDPALTIASLVLPTGTTANINVVYSGALEGSFIEIYNLTGYKSATPTDSKTSNVTGSNPSLNLLILGGGAAVGGYVSHGDNLSGVTWTGLTENIDQEGGSPDYPLSAASQSSLDEQTRTISVAGPSTGRELLVAASWR